MGRSRFQPKSVGPTTVLASFPRKHPETGEPEMLRLTTGEYNARQVTHVRTHYLGKKDDDHPDGWHPTQRGVTVRENEIDTAIQACRDAARIMAEGGPETVLASWRRKSMKTGQPEQLRLIAREYQGKWGLHVRTFFQAAQPSGEDDGFRPSRDGAVIRRHELDEVIEGLLEARRMIHELGHSTAPPPPGERNPRPAAIERIRRIVGPNPWDRPGEVPDESLLSPRDRRTYQVVKANREAGREPARPVATVSPIKYRQFEDHAAASKGPEAGQAKDEERSTPPWVEAPARPKATQQDALDPWADYRR